MPLKMPTQALVLYSIVMFVPPPLELVFCTQTPTPATSLRFPASIPWHLALGIDDVVFGPFDSWSFVEKEHIFHL